MCDSENTAFYILMNFQIDIFAEKIIETTTCDDNGMKNEGKGLNMRMNNLGIAHEEKKKRGWFENRKNQ